MRTDFTQEIDGAMSGRNLGQRHFSDIARSANGSADRDLTQDFTDYQEVPGIGETTEELSPADSAAIDQYGSLAKVPLFRWPQPGEVPPFASKPGSVWLRKKTITDTRKPGGKRLARVKWVCVSKERLLAMQRDGSLGDFAYTGAAVSVGLGLVGGIALWLLLKRKK